MSQPTEFGPNERDPLEVPLMSYQQLENIFISAQKNPRDFKLGVEYEMFGHDVKSAQPLSYTGITDLFTRLSQQPNVKPIFEGKNIVALSTDEAMIALEPGGQIEIALKPHGQITEVTSRLRQVTEQIIKAAGELDIKLFALGVHPTAAPEQMASVKKQRYGIMRAYMASVSAHGGLGLDMMTRSCATQINLDFSSESDMIRKTRLAARLVPFYSLLCSNSPFVDGQITQKASYRSYIWHKTDPARTGIPEFIFADNFGYRAWIDWILDIPMYFVRRNNMYHDVSGRSFREFMSSGLLGFTPTVRDFVDHMSTAFSEIRLKPFLELRTPDSLPLCYLNAYIALVWAHFYHEPTLAKLSDQLDDMSHDELIKLHRSIIDIGIKASFRGRPVLAMVKDLLDLAQEAVSTANAAPSNILQPFNFLVEQNLTLTTWAQQQFWPLDRKNTAQLLARLAPMECPGMTT